jgi:tetratricopeptide (TPR) repeat protein
MGRYSREMRRLAPFSAEVLRSGTLCLVLWCACGIPALASPRAGAAAPQDYLAQARQLASSGQRPAAIALLEDRLATRPDDLDARTLLGIVQSWEGRYAEARKNLRQVLSDRPGYHDALSALAHVELWDGHADLAPELIVTGANKDQERPFRGNVGHYSATSQLYVKF